MTQVALITGAARGIGQAIALRFGQEGARVAIIDLRETSEQMRALAGSLRDNPSSLVIERKESGLEIPR